MVFPYQTYNPQCDSHSFTSTTYLIIQHEYVRDMWYDIHNIMINSQTNNQTEQISHIKTII